MRGPDGRERVASGTPWEPRVGYARAVRVGRRVLVSGTTATAPDGALSVPSGAYDQTVRTLDNIARALAAVRSSLADVVRVRIYVTDLAEFEEVARALGERFRPIRPTMTLVEVSGLVDPSLKVEIETEAEDPPPATRGRRPGPRGSRRARGYK